MVPEVFLEGRKSGTAAMEDDRGGMSVFVVDGLR